MCRRVFQFEMRALANTYRGKVFAFDACDFESVLPIIMYDRVDARHFYDFAGSYELSPAIILPFLMVENNGAASTVPHFMARKVIG
jgi:hypothetical protein